MQYENYRNKIMRRAAALRRVIHFSPVITAAIIVFAAVFTVLAITAGTVTDVSFANSAAYGSAPVHSASAFLSKSSFEYRLKGESEWSSEAPKMPGAYDVRVVTSGFFGTRYKNLDTFHVYPRRVSVTADAETIKYGETPLVKAALNHGDRIVCESFVFESNVLANTKIKANASAIKIYNAAGEDVTYAYELETPYSDITVTKRELLVYVADATHQYDGKEFSYKVYEIGEGSLPEGERLQAKFEKTITDVGTVKNVPVLQIVNKYGEDVTHFYALNEQNVGDLIVTKRPLHIKTGTATYTFNGEARNCLEYTIGEGSSLVPGHEIIADGASTQTFIGTVNNTMSFTVKDADGNDVTDNYAITVTEGTITVEKCPLTITTGSQTWVYDGEKHSNREITHSELPCGTIPDDRYDIKDITDVGKMENSFTIRVMNGTSNITNNFDITYVYGELEVTKRPIKIETPSYSWEYDGNEHMVAELVNSDTDIKCNILEGSLLDGCLIRYDFDHYQTSGTAQPRVINVGDDDGDGEDGVKNTVPVRIFRDINDPTVNRLTTTDITKNFEITYSYGKLEVTPRPITVKPVKVTKMYDGTPLTAKELEITEGELAKDMHVMEYKLDGSRTFVTDEAVSTITEIKVISGEEDITRNYEITKEQGEIEIEPRPITIKTPDYSWVYDGKKHSVEADNLGDMFVIADASQYPLPDNHKLVYVADKDTAKPSIKNVNDSPRTNDSTVRIMMGETDVTENNFIITYEYGEFEVTKRPVKIQTPSEVWTYDGKEHSVAADNLGSGFIVLDDPQYPWLENYTLVYDVNADAEKTSITYVNNETVYNKSTVLIKTGEEDVTDNFEIKYEYGTFEVTPRQIKVQTPSGKWEYDGKQHSVADNPELVGNYVVIDGVVDDAFDGLLPNHSIKYVEEIDDYKSAIINVGSVPNESTIRIFRDGNDVTDNFAVTYDENYGIFEVTKRKITVKPVDVSKIYDGTPLVATDVEIISENGLVENHKFAEYTISGELTDVGTASSFITSIKVLDGDGVDVTDNYDIDYDTVAGEIRIDPRPITVKTPSEKWTYDGNEHSIATHPELAEKFEVAEGSLALPENHYIQYVADYDAIKSSITNVGITENMSTVRIFRDGEDITDYFNVSYEYGTFEVEPLKVIVTTPSEKWTYDGNEHSIATHPELAERFELAENSAKLPENHYIEYIADYDAVKTGITNVGSAPNQSTVCIMLNGNIVTGNFEIEYKYGEFVVTKRPVTITTPSWTWTYDGNTHSVALDGIDYLYNVADTTPYSLPENHMLVYEEAKDNIKSSIIDVKDSPVVNMSTVRIKIGEYDATENFDIKYEYGEFVVTKRPVKIQTPSKVWIYDGNEHSSSELIYEFTADALSPLPFNHEIKYIEGLDENRASIINVKESPVKNTSTARIFRGETDATENFDITYIEGEFNITPRPITVTSGSDHKRYDGTPLTNNDFEASNLVEGHYIECTATGSVIGLAGQTVTDFNTFNTNDVKVYYLSEGNEKVYVTDNYTVSESIYGELTVYPYIASITIISPDAKKVYDGTPLTADKCTVNYNYGELQEGHELKIETASVDGYNENGVLEAENTINAYVIDKQTGLPVDDGLYEFILNPGKLTVLPPNGILGFGTNPEQVFITFTPETNGPIYLKMTSKGNYNHTTKQWGEAPEYETKINGYNASYFTSVALGNLGYKVNNLSVWSTIIYMLPYYTAMGDGYDVPENDVDVKGASKGASALTQYTVPYYALNYNGILDALKGNLGGYADAELAYREFVYDNYLSVDDDTKNYLNNNVVGLFDKNSPSIIRDVAEYIQNVAKYNLDYDKGLDTVDNVIIFFLDQNDEYNEGICQHYAAAATLLYRTLGIPARYVEGFVDFEAKAGQTSTLKGADCHAWVEVYIDGLGWIQVEVTGGTEGSAEEDKRDILIVKPVYQSKVADGGDPLTADKIVITPELRKLLAEGYSYTVEIVGKLNDNFSAAAGTSWITNFKLYDPDGNDITETYNVKYEQGALEILPPDYKILEVYLGESHKRYDGAPPSSPLYYVLNSNSIGANVNLDLWLVASDVMMLHITELNDNVNKYAEYKVSDGSQDVTDKYRVKFVIIDSLMNEEDYVPIEITKRTIEIRYNEFGEAEVKSGIVQGHTFVANDAVTGKQNVILDEYGNDVSHNYKVVFI